ncbi:hypothetical protein ACSBR2_002946 [Camellia fascicularis]
MYYHGCYDPLQYPLLFSYSETGWHRNVKRKGKNIPLDNTSIFAKTLELLASENEASHAVTSDTSGISCCQFYCYLLQIRPSQISTILLLGRLLQ